MSQTKREQVISHIRYLRQELREMQLGIKEDDLLPDPGELRGLIAQLEALSKYFQEFEIFKILFRNLSSFSIINMQTLLNKNIFS